MTAELIDGKAVAAKVRQEVAAKVAGGPAPGLATVLVGEDPASEVYVRSKRRACVAAGMAGFHRRLPGTATQQQVDEELARLAEDPAVSGILLQLPLPGHLDADALIDRIPVHKDVDGLTPGNAGRLAQGRDGLRPCTPAGIERLLDEYAVPLSGAKAVVVGRSVLVGRPMAHLLLTRDATVTLCHSRTKDLAAETRTADILIVAAGIPGLIGREHVRPGATVIDVGIHRSRAGLHGDVRFPEVREIAGLLTPVPGGVGPMTIAMLLANTLHAARRQEP
ncbi:bifunctional methylenetetrahydrofolate dehydrogenase/methenyltetrahydrofolate cyclohydrolase FolD [Amycolatopsis jejuensis]|uniref:bifunctional methylenetetrahydrofolate dehydrogenase/methenyltetrahydrofolate cyclohydrolase FolD n=1 Tax=Amycolatopsis jejuensis TaxID=330084 RepID=UPI000524DEE6|nr:bifunctional methylenetetrahydrofolate dehydrogenase/methenyltetrahydrofolate cyclohydrolase FolD [Amycolatopsis jejuensis]